MYAALSHQLRQEVAQGGAGVSAAHLDCLFSRTREGYLSMSIRKSVSAIHTQPVAQWVGDGFPVRTIFSPQSFGKAISPFILMDYAGPTTFGPSEKPRGVDEHPHKGFETVSIVYQGELEHHDSAGNSGSLRPGDVQWMTAARGIAHEEKHSAAFTRRGGVLEMVQLWVNLPARFKSSPPRYQTLLASAIPIRQVGGEGASVRIIAGELEGTRGPAQTFTPIILSDAELKAHQSIELSLPNGFTTMLFVRRGNLLLNNEREAKEVELAIFSREGETLHIAATTDAAFLVPSGEPIDEPVAAYGPFVMNTIDEISQTIEEYNMGTMGRISS